MKGPTSASSDIQAGVIEFLSSRRNAQIRLRPDDPLARAAASLAPSSAIAPWRSAIALVAPLVNATLDLEQPTISALASAQAQVASAQQLGWRGWTRSHPTGSPDYVRSELRSWLTHSAGTLGYALAFGPPVGVVEVSADKDGKANLVYFAGKSHPRGNPDLIWTIERSGSITTTRGHEHSLISSRIKDSLHAIAAGALDSAANQHAPVHMVRAVS